MSTDLETHDVKSKREVNWDKNRDIHQGINFGDIKFIGSNKKNVGLVLPMLLNDHILSYSHYCYFDFSEFSKQTLMYIHPMS